MRAAVFTRTPRPACLCQGLIATRNYFFKSRGAKGGLLATGGALLMLLLSGTLSYAGSWAVYEGLQR